MRPLTPRSIKLQWVLTAAMDYGLIEANPGAGKTAPAALRGSDPGISRFRRSSRSADFSRRVA